MLYDQLKFVDKDLDVITYKQVVKVLEHVNEVLMNHIKINSNQILNLHHNHIHHLQIVYMLLHVVNHLQLFDEVLLMNYYKIYHKLFYIDLNEKKERR